MEDDLAIGKDGIATEGWTAIIEARNILRRQHSHNTGIGFDRRKVDRRYSPARAILAVAGDDMQQAIRLAQVVNVRC